MVSQKEKKQAIEFICGKLEDSGLYLILKAESLVVKVQEKPEVREQPRTICTVIPNFLGKIEEFKQGWARNYHAGIFTAPLLYKDGKTAFVRMVDRNLSWRKDKSLKNYSPQQINEILHLRRMEKAVLDSWGQRSAYYQPETTRLEESLREFEMKTVYLDYSHIGPGDQSYGFVHNHDSIDYKLPIETDKTFPAARFAFSRNENDLLKRAALYPAENQRRNQEAKEELAKIAQNYFSELEPDEAYGALLPDK